MTPTSPTPTVLNPHVGQLVFGRFELIRLLGEGGMGLVWLAQDRTLQMQVALKFISENTLFRRQAIERLKAETIRALELTHEHIVRIRDFFEADGHAAIAMEYIEGRTLADYLVASPQGVLSAGEILPLVVQLASAIDYAHGKKIIHRDIKPANVMIAPDGRLKIADFGISRSLVKEDEPADVGGTPAYTSPQQLLGKEAPSPADDLYSLGATLFELLTGQPPFVGDPQALAVRIGTERPPAISVLRQELHAGAATLPAHWDVAIAACLEKDPAKRPPSAQALADWLADPAYVPPHSVPASDRVERPLIGVHPWRKRMFLGVLGVGLVLVATFLLQRRSESSVAMAPAFRAACAVAAWDLAGNGRDDSGHGLDAVEQVRSAHSSGAMPTRDHFGRERRALRFDGGTRFAVADRQLLSWSGQDAFTAVLWLKRERGGTTHQYLLSSAPSETGGFQWQIDLKGGRPGVQLKARDETGSTEIRSPTEVPTEQWIQVAATSDGVNARLFVGGNLVATVPLGQATANAAAPEHVDFSIAGTSADGSADFSGALSDVRLWRRCLNGDEIAALSQRPSPPRLALTHGRYSERSDLAAMARSEFGPEAEIADWDDLRSWYGDDALDLCNELALRPGDSAFVLRGSAEPPTPPRQYVLTRIDGKGTTASKALGELGDGVLALSTDFDRREKILVRLGAQNIDPGSSANTSR